MDSVFERNLAWWKGGAVAQTSGLAHITISGSRFIGNEAGEEGGAVYFGGEAASTGVISNSSFEENYSQWGGGAVNNKESRVTVGDGTRIVNNMAAAGGGGIHNTGNMKISDSLIAGNHTTTSWTGSGGGIYNTITTSGAGKMEIDNTEISGNHVAASGGGKTAMTGIAEHSVYDDRTLGRVEIGGEFSFGRFFRGYLSAGRTFGDDYEGSDINL